MSQDGLVLIRYSLTSADNIPWSQRMLSGDCKNPLLASMITPALVIPTVCVNDCSIGVLKGTKSEFIGLCGTPFPTNSLSSTIEMFFRSRLALGPIPLSSSSWGLPIAPDDTMISLPCLFDSNAWCCFFVSSLNVTPIALHFFPVSSNTTFAWIRTSHIGRLK